MVRKARWFLSLCTFGFTLVATSVTFAESPGIRPSTAKATPGTPKVNRSVGKPVDVGGMAVGTLSAIPHDAKIRRYVAGVGIVDHVTPGEVRAGEDACRYDPDSVYCNTLGRYFWQPPGGNPNILVADDIAIAAVAGCELDRYVVMVTGNEDGAGVGGFTVTAALYPGCPGAGNVAPISGTECQVAFEDNGIELVTCPVAPGVLLPQNLFLALTFSRLHCGIAVGAPALKGFSADTLDFPGFACRAGLGGYFPSGDDYTYGIHASFYAEIYVRGDCPAAFPGYKSSSHAGLSYTPGGGIRFADDITLAVSECNMVAYEVAIRGDGVTNIDLRTALDDADPFNGGVIPGTRFFVIGSLGVVVGRKEFDPPIPLTTTELWVGYHTTTAVTGPIITRRPPALGENDDSIAVHNGTQWQSGPLPDGRYAATDVTIFCEGSPPLGVCCDMVFTGNDACVGGPNDGAACSRMVDCPEGTCVGDSVCRDSLAEMNCPFTRWIESETCDTAAFAPPCGVSACCTFSNECLDVTERECFGQPPIDRPRARMFNIGGFCDDLGLTCPWVPCMDPVLENDCRFPRDEPGCNNPPCCGDVCDFDRFCCEVVWDELCVRHVYRICGVPPPNDECSGPGREGATVLEVPSTVLVSTETAWGHPSDSGFPCHAQEPGARATGTVWYKFVAPGPPEPCTGLSSVDLSTCSDEPLEMQDSLIQVFEVAQPDHGMCDDGSACSVASQDCSDGLTCTLDEASACEGLIPIACDDDSGCPNTETPANAALTVPNLVPGQTYYVMIGVKEAANLVTYRLHVAPTYTPCPPLPNDACSDATGLAGASMVVPFDLAGGGTYATATLDSANPPDILPNMQNDVWYEWVAPCTGQAKIDTCDRAAPEGQQPNTTMIVYEGCDCPVENSRRIAHNDFCGFGCGPSSCVEIDVTEGQCYKIRLGGHNGGTPDGDLAIDAACNCVGAVTFLDPPSGVVDARRPHPATDANAHEGIDTLVVEGSIGLTNSACWSVCETPSGSSSNRVESIVENGDGTFTARLDRPIKPGAVTTVTYNSEGGASNTGTFTFHPSNANGDGEANAADVQVLIDVLNGARSAAWGHFSTDCDHSGSTTPADVLCVIDLLNGGDAYAPGYNGTDLPTNNGICP